MASEDLSAPREAIESGLRKYLLDLLVKIAFRHYRCSPHCFSLFLGPTRLVSFAFLLRTERNARREERELVKKKSVSQAQEYTDKTVSCCCSTSRIDSCKRAVVKADFDEIKKTLREDQVVENSASEFEEKSYSNCVLTFPV
jgi:hypothetical protein